MVPKLAKLPERYIYEPWKAPTATQKAAGVLVGSDYPRPIVDHSVVSKGRGSHTMLLRPIIPGFPVVMIQTGKPVPKL